MFRALKRAIDLFKKNTRRGVSSGSSQAQEILETCTALANSKPSITSSLGDGPTLFIHSMNRVEQQQVLHIGILGKRRRLK